MNRREFLELLASAGVGLGLSQFPLKRLVQTNPLAARFSVYEEQFKTTACGLCPAGCSLRARLVNGHLVGVAGNPLDPFTGGGLCPKAFSIVHQLYHPDRLKKPLRKTGTQWKVVEWDEALTTVASELRRISDTTPERIVFLNGRPFGFMNLLIDRWMQHLGSPNHIADHYLHAFPIATRYMMGSSFYPACKMSRLDLLVSVGDSFLDYSISPANQTRQYAMFRRERKEGRGRLIVFDDVKGITAEKADLFHRIEPGSHGAVLLALANVLVRFERYDREFTDKHTTGLQEWNQHVLQEYSPENVESISGVPADVFYQLATELASTEHKAVTCGPAAMSGRGGLHTAMSLLALNALLGALDRDFGMESPVENLIESDLFPEKSEKKNQRIDRQKFPLGRDAPWVIPDVIESNSNSVEALFLYYSNPLAGHPGAGRWLSALQHIPLIVSFSPFLDETSAHAHWILPDNLCLERQQDFVHPPVTGINRISVSQPLWEKPLFDTRSTGDVLLDMIHHVRPNSESLFPWKNYSEYLSRCFRLIYRLGTGTVYVEPQQYQSFIELANQGYRAGAISSEDAFVDTVYESGGWIQPVYIEKQWGRLVHTPSGKFEFASSTLKTEIEAGLVSNHKTLRDFGLEEAGGIYHMPCFQGIRHREQVGKLGWLVTWNSGSQTELPWWWEIVGMHRYLQWQMWAELGTENPKAARLDASQRPWCEFRLKGQSFRLPVVLRFQGHKNVLLLPVGFHSSVERSTPLPRGFNIMSAIECDPDPLTGLPSYYFDIDSLKVIEAEL